MQQKKDIIVLSVMFGIIAFMFVHLIYSEIHSYNVCIHIQNRLDKINEETREMIDQFEEIHNIELEDLPDYIPFTSDCIPRII